MHPRRVLGLVAYGWLTLVLFPEPKEEAPLPGECLVPGASWQDCLDAIRHHDEAAPAAQAPAR
jgi:hypothetical protein